VSLSKSTKFAYQTQQKNNQKAGKTDAAQSPFITTTTKTITTKAHTTTKAITTTTTDM